jgi:hypothetical protein
LRGKLNKLRVLHIAPQLGKMLLVQFDLLQGLILRLLHMSSRGVSIFQHPMMHQAFPVLSHYVSIFSFFQNKTNAQSFFNDQASHSMASVYSPGPSRAQKPARPERRLFNHRQMRCIQELHCISRRNNANASRLVGHLISRH